MIRRLTLAAAAATGLALAVATPALAHIHTDPEEVQAGSTATIGFRIGHGCDGSPTVEVALQIPDGVTDATPEPFDGFDATVDEAEGVITFSGGSLPDGTEGVFQITMTVPPTPDTMLWFPMVQRCEVGDYHWIQIPDDDGGSDDHDGDEPAPGVLLVGPVFVPDTTVPETTEPPVTPTSEPASETTEPAPTPETTEAAAETTEPAVIAPPPTTTADVDSDDGSGVGTIVFIAAIAAVLVVAGLAWAASRRARAARDADETTA